ncbi:hypothetical protein [Aeromicrobium sp. PE09-221]|uniref:hypothetical protein n=1 Tax=Aeromicrobium sp. PE09-221 TaxID=1898043 RepID=UPI00111E53BC|nr:hypothetical protein [Aeromicrobium sp. PE09-221]
MSHRDGERRLIGQRHPRHRGRRLTVIALMTWFAILSPWTTGVAYAADLLFDEPEGIATGLSGLGYLTPNDPAVQPSIEFSGRLTGDLDGAVPRIVVYIQPIVLDAPELEVCSWTPGDSDNDANGDIAWSCTHSFTQDGPLPSSYWIEARLFLDGSTTPDTIVWVDAGILAPPSYDSTRIVTDTSTVTLSGDREYGMAVEVHPGQLDSRRDTPADSGAVCVDADPTSARWSCTFALPEDTNGIHPFSARHVPIEGSSQDNFDVPSGFSWADVERIGAPEPPPPLEPPPPPTVPSEPLPAPEPGPTSPDPTPVPDYPPPPQELTPPPGPEPAPGFDSATTPDPLPDSTEDSGTDEAPAAGDAPAAAVGDSTERPETGWDTPTEYGTALRTPATLTEDLVRNIVSAGAVATAFVFFVALPAELLYATLQKNYARAFGWTTGLRRLWTGSSSRWTGPSRQWTGIAGVLAAGAALATLSESGPASGAVVIRLFLATLFSMTIMNVGAVVMSWVILHGRYGSPTRLRAMPAFLIIAAASVLASRVFDLRPGLLFGLLLSVVALRGLDRARAGRTSAAISAGFLLLGVVSWLAYAALDPETGGFMIQLQREVLTSLTIGGIGTTMISLLPVTFMEGRSIAAWSRTVWGCLTIVAVMAFCLIVAPLPDSWVEANEQTLLWSVVFGAFGIVSIAVWAWFRFRPTPDPVRQDV